MKKLSQSILQQRGCRWWMCSNHTLSPLRGRTGLTECGRSWFSRLSCPFWYPCLGVALHVPDDVLDTCEQRWKVDMGLSPSWKGLLLVTGLWKLSAGAANNGQWTFKTEDDVVRPTISFSDHWHVLGPFQIGTRGEKTSMKLSAL